MLAAVPHWYSTLLAAVPQIELYGWTSAFRGFVDFLTPPDTCTNMSYRKIVPLLQDATLPKSRVFDGISPYTEVSQNTWLPANLHICYNSGSPGSFF